MKMQAFRCRICGETYIGYEKPSQCPYCGAHTGFLVLASEWKDEFDISEMSEISKNNLNLTMEFETSNTAFYFSAAENAKAQSREAEGIFKRLAKIEAEHASVVKKFLKLDSVPEKKEEASESILENLKAAVKREERAFMHYQKFSQEASEPRLEEFWSELSNIEKDHMGMDTEEQKNFA